MKKITFFIFAFLLCLSSNAQEVLITGYIDSTCPSALGRTLEIYVDGTVDLTGWNVVRQANGGGFTTNISLTTLGTLTDEFAYLTNDAVILDAEFGINSGNSNVLTSGSISSNGDDAFQVINDLAVVIDRFGEDLVDGTGTAWEHVDTYYYRNDNSVANAGAFDPINWTFGAQNLLDGQGLCNGGSAFSTFVPFGSFVPFSGGGVPVACEQIQVTNGFENGYFMQAGFNLVANDFLVAYGEEFTVNTITANIFAQGGISSVDVTFYDNAGGLPGAILDTYPGIVPTSQTIVGNNFGFDIYETVIDLPTSPTYTGGFTGTTTYWVQISGVPAGPGTQLAWDVTTVSAIGAFVVLNDGTGWAAQAGDDGVFTISGECATLPLPSCLPPLNLLVSNITDTSADLAWDAEPNATNGYNWYVFDNGADPQIDTPVASGSTAAGVTNDTATGLTGATTYDFYVESDCAADGLSNLNGPVTFETLLTPPACGEQFFDTGGPAGDYQNNEDVTWTILPDISGDVVTVTFTSFDVESGWDALYIFNGPDTSFPLFDSGNPATNSGFPAGGYYGTVNPGSFISTHPTGALTFQFLSDGSVQRAGWIADVTCDVAPTCSAPLGLVVTAVTDTTADLAWNAEANATNGYVWFVFENGADPQVDTPVATGTTPVGVTIATATGLNSSTLYDFYVQADCDAGGLSNLAGPVTFETDVAFPTCGGPFYDTGGPSGNYNNNADETWVIVPDNSGDAVTVTFTAFDVESGWDALYVYDGPDTSSPLISSGNPPTNTGFPAGGFYGTTNPGPFSSTHPSGALTFRFLSDGSVTRAGWAADVTCLPVPPANDLIVNAIDVDQFPQAYTDPLVRLFAATNELLNPAGCNIAGTNGVWYKFTATADGSATASITTPAGASAVIFYTAPDENVTDETNLTYTFEQSNQCGPGTVATTETVAGQSYYLFVLNTGGESDVVVDLSNAILSTSDNTIEGFTFYPNPTSNVLNVKANSSIDTITIYNTLGQQILNKTIGATTSQLNVSNLTTGVYLLKVVSEGQMGTYRLIKK